MNYMIQSVSEYSTGPTKAVTAWLTDQVAPPYWRPNAEITVSMKPRKRLIQQQNTQIMKIRFVQHISFLKLQNESTGVVSLSLVFYCEPPPFVLLRPVMIVTRCLWRRRGSTTVDHVVRVSATPAPVTGCPCQRGAGAVALSGCVRPVTDREDRWKPTARVRKCL